MACLELEYEGKAKRVYRLTKNLLLMEFKDEVTAGNGVRREIAVGKGRLTAAQTSFFMRLLESRGLRTHFIDWDGDRRIVVRRLRVLPLEVIVRNYAYGSFLKRMPLVKPMTRFSRPIVEFHYKDDRLHDPLVLPDDIVEAGVINRELLDEIVNMALKANDVLYEFLASKGLTLIDFKLEFGLDENGVLYIADEISCDTMRVLRDGEHLDKEVFRRGASAEELVKRYAEFNKIVGVE